MRHDKKIAWRIPTPAINNNIFTERAILYLL
jgi:hypothetical protein